MRKLAAFYTTPFLVEKGVTFIELTRYFKIKLVIRKIMLRKKHSQKLGKHSEAQLEGRNFRNKTVQF